MLWRRGQTSLEYLILVAGVMLVVLIAGSVTINYAKTLYGAITDVNGADVAPPATIPSEPEVPPPHETVIDINCNVVSFASTLGVGDTTTVEFDVNDTGGDLNRVEIGIYVDNELVDTYTYFLSNVSNTFYYSDDYALELDRCGDYRVLITAVDSQNNFAVCEPTFSVSCDLYFGDCNTITQRLNSDVLRSAVENGEQITIFLENDVFAESKPDGTPRRACIDVENYDYNGNVYIVGNNHTMYIPATGECFDWHFSGTYVCFENYSAYRAVYLKNVEGLTFKDIHFDCATEWSAELAHEREPCVELVNSSAIFIDSNITDFGASVAGNVRAVPILLQDSSIYIPTNATIYLESHPGN